MSTPTSTPAHAKSQSTPIIATRIFIDQVSAYTLLPSCAERPLSSIVRGMELGCGDGSRMTSYACFCSRSSTHFASLIGTQVSTACVNDPAQSPSAEALGVFDEYCQMGATMAASRDATATPIAPGAANSTSPSFQSLPSSTTKETSKPFRPADAVAPNNSMKRDITIAVAVTVPVLVIVLLSMMFFFLRRRSRKVLEIPKVAIDIDEETQNLSSSTESPNHAELAIPENELPDEATGPYAVVELGATVPENDLVVDTVPGNQYPVAELGTWL